MNRRRFLRTAGIASLGMGLSGRALAYGKELEESEWMKINGLTRLVILHTNDMHSHLEPFSEQDPKYPGQGGMARRAALIQKIRDEGHATLVLDAGDVFQGTPYFNLFKGEPEFRLMSAMGYDVGTLGNHDFDNGIDGLANMLPHANFPLINANYRFEETVLSGLIQPYRIVRRGKLNIGIIGVGVDLQGLVSPALTGKLSYQNPIPIVQDLAHRLRSDYSCQCVILLSHLGYSYKNDQISDLIVAEQTDGIDVIIGGHTHTFLDRPTPVKNKSGQMVLVSQAGWAGLRLGRLDLTFSPKGQVQNFDSLMNEISKKTIGF
ncbi:MAG: metallophosphoesterase [Bacteroidetes bacterium]|nr:metallophosphoesterase [Bacteroidota bacterium]